MTTGRYALQWQVDPNIDLAGLRVIESCRTMAPYGQLVAWRFQQGNIHKLVYFLPGPDDPKSGEPADLMPEQRIRRETNIVYLVDPAELADFIWVREFRRDCDKPSGLLSRLFWNQVAIVAYSETAGEPNADGRWQRRVWGFWRESKKPEGYGPHVKSPWGCRAVDATALKAGEPSPPADHTRRIPSAARIRGNETCKRCLG